MDENEAKELFRQQRFPKHQTTIRADDVLDMVNIDLMDMSIEHEDKARHRINNGDTFDNCLISYKHHMFQLEDAQKNKRHKMNVAE